MYLYRYGSLEAVALARVCGSHRPGVACHDGVDGVDRDGRIRGARGCPIWPGVAASSDNDRDRLPALYVGLLAVPGVTARKRVFGRPVGEWAPVELGVHEVIDRGPMPAYVRLAAR